MRILIVTDAWFPQVNGVVRTLHTVSRELRNLGHDVDILSPEAFKTVPCPSYPEIRLALCRPAQVGKRIDAGAPSAIHIATEGPLGLWARRHCRVRGYPFTTSLHTRFPEYIAARWAMPLRWSYGYMRWFHGGAARTMVATRSVEDELRTYGFERIVRWSRGVDLDLFHPRPKTALDAARPISMFVGRVAIEKNIEAFLQLDWPGSKVVVGDGPQLPELRRKYPGVLFVGMKTGEDLAQTFASADVFVFPSRTDTFGLVLLEALASGVPVAAYPVPGPIDVIGSSGAGCLDEDLAAAARQALTIPADVCRAHAEHFSWGNSARQFLGHLQVFQ